jgi:uncharacterized protein YndB with AHSA1/START domain
MTDLIMADDYATLIEPDTLRIQRILPGPIERVFAYLADGDLRRQSLASGEMEKKVGAPFTLTWRNDELSDVPSKRPEGFGEEHSMESKVLELDEPRKLAFSWGESGKVTFELEPKGDEVLLTLVHERLPAERSTRLNICAGWHSHLDVLAARVAGRKSGSFWENWTRLKGEYEGRVPA